MKKSMRWTQYYKLFNGVFFTGLLVLGSLAASCSKESPTATVDFKHRVESPHFEFYSQETDTSISALSKALETNFERISTKYGAAFNRRIRIEVFPDLKTFHRAYGIEDDTGRVVGASIDFKKIAIVSPSNPGPEYNHDDILSVGVHEFTHLVTGTVNRNAPDWIDEGIAVYEAGQVMPDEVVPRLLAATTVPSIDDLERNFMQVYGYDYSGLLIRYLVDTYSHKSLRVLLNQPQDFERILGVSKAEFSKRWKTYLSRKYA